jgi:DNA primase
MREPASQTAERPSSAAGPAVWLSVLYCPSSRPRLLRGTGPQRRGTCPSHRGDRRGKTFSVNLDEHVFQCFAKECGAKGDVIELWSSVNRMSLREAALDLVRTFHLEPAPKSGTEKRNG